MYLHKWLMIILLMRSMVFSTIFNYSVPCQGRQSVVKCFTKLDGLVVFRRDDDELSDTDYLCQLVSAGK